MSDLYLESGGTWNVPKKVFAFQNGVWQPVKQIYVNFNGVWYPIWNNALQIDITANTTDFNLYNFLNTPAELANYGLANLQSALTIHVIVHPGVVMGASSTNTYGFNTGSGWAAGTRLKISVMSGAYIVGAGGVGGGNPGHGISPYGGNGGGAIWTNIPTQIDNQGTIGGGGGGGGGAVTGDFGYWQLAVGCGGGGAGSVPGAGGNMVSNYGYNGYGYIVYGSSGGPGSLLTGGYSSRAQYSVYYATGAGGGALGQAGGNGYTNAPGGAWSGGAPGSAIVGKANVTWINQGTLLGPTV